MKFKEEFDLVKNTVEEAGELLRSYFGKDQIFVKKEDSSLVSKADHESEALLEKRLKEKYPKSEFIGEEYGLKKGLEGFKRRWAVDPLDGTTNFLYGIPYYCVSVAMEYEGEWVLGYIYNPQSKDTYWAVKGEGAYFNNKQIQCGKTSSLNEAMVGIGRLFAAVYDKQVDDLYHFLSNVRAVRSSGSAALDLAKVAQGGLDLYLCKGLNIWDTAAAFVILKEAGACVKDFHNKEYNPTNHNIVACNKELMEQFQALSFQL